MTTVRKRFSHPCFVSFNRFDASIEKVLSHTVNKVPDEIKTALTPLYIGIEVEFSLEESKLKMIREFFKRLRPIHGNHFVRFVVDTMWAMESDNADLFYCHDEDKQDRCDIVWSIKAVNDEQVQVTLQNTDNSERRKILKSVNDKFYSAYRNGGAPIAEDMLPAIVKTFCRKTKGIHQLLKLKESAHVILLPNYDNTEYRPVLVCGLSSTTVKKRNGLYTTQLESQTHTMPEFFSQAWRTAELMDFLIEDSAENGRPDEKHFNAASAYSFAESIYSIYSSLCKSEGSNNDIVIFHCTKTDGHNDYTTMRFDLGEIVSAS